LKGLRRTMVHATKQAKPMTPDMLKKIHDTLNFSDAYQVSLWSTMLSGFYMMLRKSNLVPKSVKAFKASEQLTRGDIKVNKKALLVYVRWSKTIQFRQKVLKFPILAKPKSRICPVKAYRDMIKLHPGNEDEPAFSVKDGAKLKPITYRRFNKFIKTCVQNIGYDPKGYSSHSLRRGGATWAMQQGVPSELVAIYGDWASECYKRYIDWSLDERLTAASKL